jgi:hypothetical protein
MKILKYELEVADEQSIDTYQSFITLDVQLQHNKIVLWAMVDTKSPPMERKFSVYGTGQEVNPQDAYIGTVQTEEGYLVWHIFEMYDYFHRDQCMFKEKSETAIEEVEVEVEDDKLEGFEKQELMEETILSLERRLDFLMCVDYGDDEISEQHQMAAEEAKTLLDIIVQEPA